MNEYPIYKCKECGDELSEEEKEEYYDTDYCPFCGFPLSQRWRCGNCELEYKRRKQARFCCQQKIHKTLEADFGR